MTNPFHSIISTQEHPADYPLDPNGKSEDRSAFAEALADDIRADEIAEIAVSIEGNPFGTSGHSAPIETGLCAAQEANKLASERALLPQQRKKLRGDIYTPKEALELLNSHFFIGKNNQETAIFRINDDGSATFVPPDQFKLDVANIFVRTSGGRSKPIPAEKFWKESPKRHELKIVFKPGGTTDPGEFNLFRGFGVEPRKGWQKQRRLLQHNLKIICRSDKAKFKYLLRYLAWTVQNPDKHPGVAIILKSRKEGTGKSTLGGVMLKIFGPHGALIDDKERLLGRFNDWLEKVCFVLAEEILFAGDHKTTDKLKSMITADTIQIERKHGSIREIQNRLTLMMASNHDHAVGAGVGDRRYVLFEVSDERASDKSWFDPLYRDLDDGGVSEFLYFLQNMKLGNWHPRQILKTAETTEQQRMSGDSVSQWSQACIDADGIVGAGRGPYGVGTVLDLGTPISLAALYEAYTGFCKHPLGPYAFGKACADMFGPRKRLKALQNATGNGRPWGYHVPTGKKWQEKVDARLGIKN